MAPRGSAMSLLPDLLVCHIGLIYCGRAASCGRADTRQRRRVSQVRIVSARSMVTRGSDAPAPVGTGARDTVTDRHYLSLSL